MRFITRVDLERDSFVYTLEIENADIIAIPLDSMDHTLIDECEKSHKIADKLLGLEMVVRKIEQAALTTKQDN